LSYFSQTKGEREIKTVETSAIESKPETPAPVRKPVQEIVSTLGPGLLVTGTVISTGSVQIFGRVIGDIHAARLLIAKGAEVEGTVMAQDTSIEGHFKGVIHSNSVKLQASAVVEGEIFKQSLVIEQSSQFEGVARRLATAVEAPTAEQIKGPKAAPAVSPSIQPLTQNQGYGVNGNAQAGPTVGMNGNGQFHNGAPLNGAANGNGPSGTTY
jgi:cytoskeletal protein CcmA (bactofilin family)